MTFIIGMVIGALLMYIIKGQPDQLQLLRQEVASLNRKAIFYELVEKTRLTCTFLIKQIDQQSLNEQVISWIPEVIVQASKQTRYFSQDSVAIVQSSFGGEPTLVCTLIFNLGESVSSITLKTNDDEIKYDYIPGEDCLVWLKLRSLVKPPLAALHDSEADEIMNHLRGGLKPQLTNS